MSVSERISALPERFQEKISPQMDGCWLWTASVDRCGYGRTKIGSRKLGAHRVVYELLIGPIEAETLDHLCRVRSCVRPSHLEPVSLRENLWRRPSMAAVPEWTPDG